DRDVLTIADTARVINGRITTSSPPCPGVEAADKYGMLKPSGPVGLTYFSTQSPTADFFGQAFMQLRMFGAVESSVSGGRVAPTSRTLPYELEAATLPRPACLPSLTSRVSITPARQTLDIAADQIAPTDRELVVRNGTTGVEYRFPRNLAQFEFTIDGSFGD